MLEEMLKAMKEEQKAWQPNGTGAEMIEALEEQLFGAQQANPFKVGDYITPKKSSDVKGSGLPRKVIQIKENEFKTPKVTGSPLYRHNMVVAVIVEGDLEFYSADFRDYETFIPDNVDLPEPDQEET